MKKLLACLLIVVSLTGCIPVMASDNADYTPALGMTINEFVNKYNLIQSPLGAPYKRLPINANIVSRGIYTCAAFTPADKSGIEMLAVTLEENAKTADAGADAVFLFCYKDSDWLSFIATAKRITSLFSMEMFGVNYAGLYVGMLTADFYETSAKEDDSFYYVQLGADSNYCAALYYYNGTYAFVLTTLDELDRIMNG